MIIGPFWCEQNNSWLRIIMDEHNAYAEMAPRNKDNPQLALEWKKEESQDFWVIHYAQNSDVLLNEGLRLFKGTLFSTDFIESTLTHIVQVKMYRKDGTTFPFNIVKEKFNPFDGKSLPELTITPFNELPDTPEIHAEKEQLREQQLIAEQETQRKRWVGWKRENHRGSLEIVKLSTFNQHQTDFLYEEINRELIDFSPVNYASVEEYELALKNAISNPEDPHYIKLIHLASKTQFEQDFKLNPSNSPDIRNDLYQRKQAFFLSTLEAEYNQLRADFKMDSPPVKPAPLKSINIENNGESHQNDFQPEEAEPIDAELEKALIASLQDDKNDPLGEEDESLQAALEASRNDPVEKIDQIKIAVKNAVEKYQQWYHGVELRGPNGFFTFIRHGKGGQKVAQKLQEDIESTDSDFEATFQLNHLLSDTSTRYHKHSLASFLLDELTRIAPWHGLKANVESNRYDQQELINHINQQAGMQLN